MEARAFAPASVGNVAVGFDLLGHTVEGPGDLALVRKTTTPGVRIAAVRGCAHALPLEAENNTAGAGLLALLRALQIDSFGFEVELDKGIPFGSGMGGSAASAVAALVAANALLDAPLSREALYPFALAGEAVASGSAHGDNVGPMLLGGLTLATHDRVLRLPVPAGLTCLLVHPHAVLETRRAREVLAKPYALQEVVAQNERLAMFLVACHRGERALLRGALEDVLVEPRRAPLVPGFAAAKRAALDAGAIGASLSGAGPSLFAWFEDRASAERAAPLVQAGFASPSDFQSSVGAVERAFRPGLRPSGGHDTFMTASLQSEAWISPVDGPRAELLERV